MEKKQLNFSFKLFLSTCRSLLRSVLLRPRVRTGAVLFLSLFLGLSSFVFIQAIRYGIFGALVGFEDMGDGNQPIVLTDAQYKRLAREFEDEIFTQRVEILSGELSRVRDYEKQLSGKASELNSLLKVVRKQNIRDIVESRSVDGKSNTYSNKSRSAKSKNLRERIGIITNNSFGGSNFGSRAIGNIEVGGVGGGMDWSKDALEKLFSGEFAVDSAAEDGIPEDNTVGSIGGFALSKELEQIISRLRYTPIGIPAHGSLSSGFGMRGSPFSYRGWQMHSGFDISASMRTPIKVTADGVVKQASWDGAFGQMIVIDHGNGYETCYAHLSSMLVKNGDRVSRGDVVGLLGATGRTTGAHVHYEIRYKDKPINPSRYVKLGKELGAVEFGVD